MGFAAPCTHPPVVDTVFTDVRYFRNELSRVNYVINTTPELQTPTSQWTHTTDNTVLIVCCLLIVDTCNPASFEMWLTLLCSAIILYLWAALCFSMRIYLLEPNSLFNPLKIYIYVLVLLESQESPQLCEVLWVELCWTATKLCLFWKL